MRWHNGPRHGQRVPERLERVSATSFLEHGVRYDYERTGAEFFELVAVKLAVPIEPSRRAFYDRKQHDNRTEGGRFA